MDDFKKEYEYVEESNGYIRAFAIMIISIDLLFAILYTKQVYNAFDQFILLRTCFLLLCIFNFLFIPFTAVMCFKMNRYTVMIAKLYILMKSFYTTFCTVSLFIYNISDKHRMLKTYNSVSDLTFKVLVIPLSYVLVFSVGWYLYFKKSKKCKELISHN